MVDYEIERRPAEHHLSVFRKFEGHFELQWADRRWNSRRATERQVWVGMGIRVEGEFELKGSLSWREA